MFLQDNGASRRPTNGFGSSSSSNSNKNKKYKNVFLTKIRCVLILIMASTLFYMFQMAAHSSTVFSVDDHHRPQSALSIALQEHNQGYSTYQQLKKRDKTTTTTTSTSTEHEGAAKTARERQLAHEQLQQQQQVDNQYSRYVNKPQINPSGATSGVTGEEEDKQQQQQQHQQPQHNTMIKKSRPPDIPIHPHNIFSQRADDNKKIHLGDENKAQVAEKERALRKDQHESARRESLRIFQDGVPALDDPKRGGAAAKMDTDADERENPAEVRAIKAAFALEAAKREEESQAEDGLIQEQENNNKGKKKKKDDNVAKKDRMRVHEMYENAVVALRDPVLREAIDPLFITPLDTPLDQIPRVPFEPQVEYLGCMVDAGRHFFPISWLKHLIVYLYKLRFNMIHFRLTDDQTFNLQLESYPQLANPVLLKYNTDKKTYTRDEVQDLVRFAKKFNISIVPEINVPGHAGGFAGIKDLVILCAEFICNAGYGLPLNVEHPELKTILKSILKEVLETFDNPPFLHLGGDEVNMADPCFAEARLRPFNYSNFEADLKDILGGLNYPVERVIRWERTGQSLSLQRAGNIEHFWENLPGMKAHLAKQPDGTSSPWIASTGLYFDTNHDDDAMKIYRNTQKIVQMKGVPVPKSIVAGTFELGTEFWLQRNVAARLISVAVGASKANLVEVDFRQLFNQTCLDLDVDGRWCDLQGNTATLKKHYQLEHAATWSSWKNGICLRLTEDYMKLVLKTITGTKKELETNGYSTFWEHFGEDTAERDAVSATGRSLHTVKYFPLLGKHAIPFTGVIFDMVNSIKSPPSRVLELIKTFVSPLGFKLLQLRLVDDFGFGIRLETQPKLGYFANRHIDLQTNDKGENLLAIPKAEDFRELVTLAMNETGIQIVPELTLSTNAGGWLHSGFAAACPHVLCDKGKGIASAVSDAAFLPVVYSVLREVRDIFSSSPFIHLGSDDRQAASKGCLKEALSEDPMADLSQFEEKLALLTEMLGIEHKHILRWNNLENNRYSDRTGQITHYQAQPHGQLPKPKPKERFFATVDLLTTGSPWDIYKETLALVKIKPEGIMGEVRDIGEDSWKTKNVGLRLVAFAMGLQQDADLALDQKSFAKVLAEACRASKIVACDKPDGSKISIPIEVEQSRYKDKICSEFTYNTMGRAPRKHIP